MNIRIPTLLLAFILAFGGIVFVAPSDAHAQRTTRKTTHTVKRTTTHRTRPHKKVVRRTTTRHHRPYVSRTHVRHRYVPRNRTYRYVRYPRFRWVFVTPHTRHYYSSHHHIYYDHDPDVVVIEADNTPELPELDCPIRTEMQRTERETFCSTDRGTRHGPFVRYYENGEVAAEGNYEYGTREGFWIEYYDNGVTRSEGQYKNGERDGTWLRFDREGNETSVTDYVSE